MGARRGAGATRSGGDLCGVLERAARAPKGRRAARRVGAEWTAQGELLAKAMRGEMIPSDVFDMAVKERDAFRQRKGAAAPK